ncbi:Fur family transcriptional regulator [Thermodesulfobacteriota bacterium]
MHEQDSKDRMALFVDTCKSNNLKITPQRISIYRELLKSRNHPSTDAMFQTVRKEFPNISFDTVHRTLLTFTETGIVDVVEGFGGSKRFDPDVTEHHHLHCMVCGDIVDFNHEAYNNLKIPEDIQQIFTVVGKRVVLKGICEKCNEKP